MRLEFETTSNDRRGRIIAPVNISTYLDGGSVDFTIALNQ